MHNTCFVEFLWALIQISDLYLFQASIHWHKSVEAISSFISSPWNINLHFFQTLKLVGSLLSFAIDEVHLKLTWEYIWSPDSDAVTGSLPILLFKSLCLPMWLFMTLHPKRSLSNQAFWLRVRNHIHSYKQLLDLLAVMNVIPLFTPFPFALVWSLAKKISVCSFAKCWATFCHRCKFEGHKTKAMSEETFKKTLCTVMSKWHDLWHRSVVCLKNLKIDSVPCHCFSRETLVLQ